MSWKDVGELIPPDGVCELIPGMTKAKLAQMRFNGTGPAYMKPTAKTVVYDSAVVLDWLRSTMRSGTAHHEGGMPSPGTKDALPLVAASGQGE